MPKKRDAGTRELIPTQGELDDELLRALEGESSLTELDALAASGAGVKEIALTVAARGGRAQSMRWILSKLPKPEGSEAVELRSIAPWQALSWGALSWGALSWSS